MGLSQYFSLEAVTMPATSSRKRSSSRRPEVLQKPRGVIHPRVQKVGPEHFGIVSVDCAKARSKWMLCDFYGNVLVPPTLVEHNRVALTAATAQLRQEMALHGLHDVIVAIERTGRYHHPPQQAFAAAGFEVRIVHPFATKQFRQASDPGNKTDDTDLVAIQRAAVNGFALIEAPRDDTWKELQLFIRYRRDLVFKTSALCTQIREHLEAAFPGYAACFDNLWLRACAFPLVRAFSSAEAMLEAGLPGLTKALRQHQVRYQERTLKRVLAWAGQAAPSDQAGAMHRRLALSLEDDRTRKNQEIQGLEREIASRLVRTPYVLLLSFPGINVVSAADFAGEMGPISNYANSRCITGRAGIRPSRHQSDEVDRPNGPLVRCANRKLRAAILGIADNLAGCNHHFSVLSVRWRAEGKDPRHTRVKIAQRFCRIAYQMVAGRQVFRHPCLQHRSYILDKLNSFYRDHEGTVPQIMADLQAAIEQLPRSAYAEEAKPLAEELQRIEQGRRRGPQLLGDILPIVLARLGVGALQSKESGEQDLT
jgi:transposase